MAGTYFVLVTNDVGSVTSEPATLTVTAAAAGNPGGGGGGALGPEFVLTLVLIGALRVMIRRR
jgi:hypothetical protein